MNENFSLLIIQIMQGMQTLLSRTSRIAMELRQLRHDIAQLAEQQAMSGDDDTEDDDGGMNVDTLRQFLQALTEQPSPSPTGPGPTLPPRKPRTAPPSTLGADDIEKAIAAVRQHQEGGKE